MPEACAFPIAVPLCAGMLASCSPKGENTPSEVELHSGDPMNGSPDHVFLCGGREQLLVDFRGGGLSILVRDPRSGAPPLLLSAKGQGQPFTSEHASAIMEERQLRIAFADGRTLTCTRQAE